MEKFKNKYRIPSARAQWWDYGNNAAYFVTICTAHRVHYFGEIVETRIPVETQIPVETRLIASLRASPQGQTAEHYWHAIPAQFPFVELGAFVVMPNHIHGIIIIDKPDVETRFIASVDAKTGGFAGNKNPMIHDNLSRIIRWYKGICTFEMRKTQADFAWQSRFHDHIIRDDTEYQRINDYIETNPQNWENDTFFRPEEL